MNTPQLGSLITNAADRDAVHIAIAPVEAGYSLSPGQHVYLSSDGRAVPNMLPFGRHPTIGIVDPFLKAKVQQGEKFWLVLYPNTVTSLRHEWTHPAFQSLAADTTRELQLICADYHINYRLLIEDGHDNICAGEDAGDMPDRFWDLYQAITGRVVASDDRYIPCAC